MNAPSQVDTTPIPVDLLVLREWMDDRGIGTGPITDAVRLSGGTQNILVRFRRGSDVMVLRCPPPSKRAHSDRVMEREARVLGALASSNVPHPRMLGACDDTAVLGSSFFIMEAVDGENPTLGLPAGYRAAEDWRHRLGLSMADAAAAIANVDYVACGLGDLGRPDGFLHRQVPQWLKHLESYTSTPGYPGPQLPHLDKLTAWLTDNLPSSFTPGLMHGDFHFANIMCRRDRPGIAAVIDWELSTIGDPLMDLGWLLATWPDSRDAPLPPLRLEPWEGFPTAEQLISRYREQTKCNLDALPWYQAMASFKLGILLEESYARSCAGKADAAVGRGLHASAISLFDRAARTIAR